MRDGRVALRDEGLPDRITVYTTDGAIDTTWSPGGAIRLAYRGAPAIGVDTAGILWLPFNNARPGPDRPSPLLLRLRPGGTVLDTVPFPPVPDVDYDHIRISRTLPSGSTSIRGFSVPYQPHGVLAWSPTGTFGIGRTDEYRIVMLPPPRVESDPPGTVFTRDIAPVPVSDSERADARAELTERVRAAEGGGGIAIPEIPTYKPLIRRFYFTGDGQLRVSVSMPSRLVNDEWVEPAAFDVFTPDGRYRGRLLPPDSLSIDDLRGDMLWGVHRGENDVQSVRVYRIEWQ